jgi:hypothetical protein
MAKAKTLIIDRSKWLRGKPEDSRLRNRDGEMCCLGFFGLACGIPIAELEAHRTPLGHTLTTNRNRWPEWLVRSTPTKAVYAGSPQCGDLMGDNDSRGLTEPEREERIAATFAKHGVTVVFK